MSGSRSTFAFGEAVWNRKSRRLTVRGAVVALPHRAGNCLDLLIDAGGEPVPRESLLATAWEGTFVEDSNLSHSILALRRALDPAPDGESYVETVPRVGYRLAVPVVDEPMAPAATPPAPPDGAAAAPREALARRMPVLVSAILLIVAAVVVFGLVPQVGANRSADEAIREGFWLLRRGNHVDAAKAEAYFDRALELETGSALARAGIAEAAARLGKQSFDVAASLARDAVASDPACDECQAILGYILMTRGWQWAEAYDWLQRSRTANPRAVQRRLWLAHWYAIHSRFDEAAAEVAAALAVARTNAAVHATDASVLYLRGRPAEAIEAAGRAAALNVHHQPAWHWLVQSYILLDDPQRAAYARTESDAAWNNLAPADKNARLAGSVRTIEAGGRAALVRDWLREVSDGTARDVHRYHRAVWHMWVGDHDGALDELEAAVAARPFMLIFAAADPMFAPLHGDPRFDRVVEGLGLPRPAARPERATSEPLPAQ